MMTMTITKSGNPLVVFKEVEKFEITDPSAGEHNGTLKIMRLWKNPMNDDPDHTVPVKKGMDYQISHECGCK